MIPPQVSQVEELPAGGRAGGASAMDRDGSSGHHLLAHSRDIGGTLPLNPEGLQSLPVPHPEIFDHVSMLRERSWL